MTDEERARYAITGWPKPTPEEQCIVKTIKGERCKHRLSHTSKVMCQQHERMARAKG